MLKLAILGLDGLFPEFIDSFSTVMPNLKGIKDEGFSADLNSTIPPYTPQAWTTLVTGVNPGVHGISGFTEFKNGQEQLLDRENIHAPQLWDYLRLDQVRTGLLNIPVSFPSPEINGFAVSGMLTPRVNTNGFTWPASLAKELLEKVPGYVIDTAVKKKDAQTPGVWPRLEAMLHNRISACRHLLASRPVDVFFCVFVILDRVFHLYFRYLDPEDKLFESSEGEKTRLRFEPILKELDLFIGEIRGKAENVIIVSDHGFRKEEGKFYTNRFLSDHGFIKLKHSFTRTAIDLSIKLIGRDRLRRILPRSLIEKGLKGTTDTGSAGLKAQSSPLVSQGIIVESNNLRLEIIDRLKRLKDPRDGLPLFSAIFLREDIYHGYETDRFPQLVLEIKNGGIEASPHVIGKDFLRFVHNKWPGGHHDRKGFFGASGRGIRAESHEKRIEMHDVLPTILKLLKIKEPAEIEGKPVMSTIGPVTGEN